MCLRGELNAISKPRLQVAHERNAGLLAALANVPGNDQFGVGIDPGPRPNVASAFRGALGEPNVLVLGVAERPNFVAPNGLGGDIADVRIMERRASQPSINQQLGNGIDRNAGHSGNRPHRTALAQHAQDLDAGF